MLDYASLSSAYTVVRLGEAELPQVLRLCAGNPLFYRYCPPAASVKTVRDDMTLLPPGKSAQDKYFLGFYAQGRLTAVLDLIDGYPDAATAFIGLFMVEAALQGQGVGTAILSACCARLQALGKTRVRLGRAAGNPQSAAFWRKNGFHETGRRLPGANCTIVEMERLL